VALFCRGDEHHSFDRLIVKHPVRTSRPRHSLSTIRLHQPHIWHRYAGSMSNVTVCAKLGLLRLLLPSHTHRTPSLTRRSPRLADAIRSMVIDVRVSASLDTIAREAVFPSARHSGCGMEEICKRRCPGLWRGSTAGVGIKTSRVTQGDRRWTATTRPLVKWATYQGLSVLRPGTPLNSLACQT
jgi:hypothetical protein